MTATLFPTRQVVRDQFRRALATPGVDAGLADEAATFVDALVPLSAMVLGIDPMPRRMAVDEVRAFGDPFTRNLLLAGTVPLTLAELVAAIDGLAGDEARPLRKLYVIAEGAAFHPGHAEIPLNTRLVFTWQKDSATAADLLLSTTTALNDPESLLQLIAWSEAQGAFHFFERISGAWAWAGNSFHALEPPSRGKGPFDSHINGGLVMKELKAPWLHWHSQSRSIPRDLVLPEGVPLFAEVEGADVLEQAVRTGVRRWTRRRLRAHLRDGQLDALGQYVRQLLWTTSLNIVSTPVLYRRLGQQQDLELPATFFMDADGLSEIAARLADDLEILPPHEFIVPAPLYLEAAADLRMQVQPDDQGGSAVTGDTDFAFAVPERAFEDQIVLVELMRAEVLSPRLALCLLLVDFPNPVFSPVRAALLTHFPGRVGVGDAGAALDAQVIAAARAAPADALPERALLAWWDEADLPGAARARLERYASVVQARLRAREGVLDLLRLADSRKAAFRARHLGEFGHTTSRLGTPVTHLAMAEDGTVFDKTTDLGEKEN